MKTSLLLLALPAGLALVYFTHASRGQSVVQGPSSAVTPGPVTVTAGNKRIPDGKGDTTPAGKFIPPTAAVEGAPVKPEEAEKKLQAALKVEELAPGKFRVGQVKFDATARTVSLPAKVNMSGGVIEYVLTTEAGKAHESMLTTSASPRDLHLACLLLGMKGAPVTGEVNAPMKIPAEQSVRISVSWETNGPVKTLPLAALLNMAEGNPGGILQLPAKP